MDEPTPEVVPQFLRRGRPAAASGGAADADAVDAVAVDATLIDSITRIVTQMLDVHVRESVTAAVRALAPRFVISMPHGSGDGDAQLRARPRRRAHADE